MNISQDGIAAIVRRECPAPDFRPVLRAYDDKNPNKILVPGDVVEGTLTWGCGHTGSDVYIGRTGTEEEAYEVLRQDCKKAEDPINSWVTAKITQAMFDSLVSFVLNVGAGAKGVKNGFVWLKNGKHSSLLVAINENRFDDVPKLMLEWVHANGGISKGLENRRFSEINQGQWTKGSFVASANVDVALPLTWWQEWHNRLIALGLSTVSGEQLKSAGSDLQGLAAQTNWHPLAVVGAVLIGIGIFWAWRKSQA